MSDRWVVVLAGAAAAGALRPAPVPLLVAVVGVVVTLRARRPVLLCVAVAVVVSGLAWRSSAGLDGVVAGDVAGTITLVTDPAPSFGGVRAEARLGRRRVEVQAGAGVADLLRPRLAGEQLRVRAALAPLAHPEPWRLARHLSARLRVFAIEGSSPGAGPLRVANSLRRTLVAGAAPLSDPHRTLFTGLVIGDDRGQPASLADDFRGAGLTHLLAVSGQNVAFVLALATPILRSLRLWPRAALALGLVGLFGVMTRFEPSVLRASAMAALALLTTTVGAPFPRLRILALAVTGLLVIDPLLVHSVGFRLSVAAAGAIVVLSDRIEGVLPGPAWLTQPLAVTISAQLGVAPILLAAFGPLPLASLPANLLAVPAAGAVMAWGLTGGMLAGVLGGAAAEVLHLPTRALLTWLEEVAARCAALPLGQLRWPHLLALGGGLAIAATPSTSRRRRLGLGVTVVALGVAVLGAQRPPGLRSDLRSGIVRWHDGGTEVVVLGGAGGRSSLAPDAALAALREAGVDGIDLLVVADPSAAGVVASIIDRHPVGTVLAADGGLGPAVDAAWEPAPHRPQVLPVGSLDVRVTPAADRLVVEATRRSG